MRDQLMIALKAAMKAGDKPRVSAIRLVQSAIKDKDIEARGLGRETATAEEILALLQKMIKQRQDSATIYRANARPELAEIEEGEIAIIQSFMPAQLDEAAVSVAIKAAIAETGASSMKDMGTRSSPSIEGSAFAAAFSAGRSKLPTASWAITAFCMPPSRISAVSARVSIPEMPVMPRAFSHSSRWRVER